MIKRLIGILGIRPVVWTQDFDGEVRLRMVWTYRKHKDAFGNGGDYAGPVVYHICCPPTHWSMRRNVVSLREDGTCSNLDGSSHYVKKWTHWKYSRKLVGFPGASA